MPKPIQHLVETIGARPTLLGSGALSLGGVTLSTASFVVGIFTLLAATGVLPNALASLGVAGGIVFTAAGPIGFLTSAGFFVFMAARIRIALGTRPPIQETGEDPTPEVSPLEQACQQIVEELEGNEEQNFIYIWSSDSNRIRFSVAYAETIFTGPGSERGVMYITLGDPEKPRLSLHATTMEEFMDGLVDHLKKIYPDAQIQSSLKNVIIIKYKDQ